MEDKAFLARIEAADDLEEIKKMFNEKGYEIDVDALQAAVVSKQGELNENDLEEVTGGISLRDVGKYVLDVLKNGLKHRSRTATPSRLINRK